MPATACERLLAADFRIFHQISNVYVYVDKMPSSRRLTYCTLDYRQIINVQNTAKNLRHTFRTLQSLVQRFSQGPDRYRSTMLYQ